MVDSFTGAVPS